MNRRESLPCLLRNPLRQRTGEAKTLLQACGHASIQGKKSLHWGGWKGRSNLVTVSNLKGQTIWLHSFQTTSWHEIWAKIWSSYAMADRSTWSMIPKESQKPLSACTWNSHKSKQQLSAESLAGRPWAEVHSGSFPSETTLVPSIPNISLVLDLGQMDPGRSLLQRPPR